MKTLVLSFVLAASSFAQQGEEAAVKAALDSFTTAAKAGDAATLGKVLHEDLVYSHSNAKVETKAEAIAALVKSKTSFDHKDVRVKVYGKSAVVTTKVSVMPNNLTITLLQVWVKNGKQWQMVARHSTRLTT